MSISPLNYASTVHEPSGLHAEGLSVQDLRHEIDDAQKRSLDAFDRADILYPVGDDVHAAAEMGAMAFFRSNPLYRDLFPQLQEFEADLQRMAIELFHGGAEARATITGGGTESILLAVKAARDRARATRPDITDPNIVLAESGHPAFLRAAQLFDLEVVKVELGADMRVDLEKYLAAITHQTVLLVGSAPSYPTGMVDPIRELGAVAVQCGIPLHVDGCLGGFFLPFAEELGSGAEMPDFRIPGVTTISADLHKFGYASTKGVSVVVHRDASTFDYQPFRSQMGRAVRYETDGMRGSRSGVPVAAAWSVMRHLGKSGYLRITAETLELMNRVRQEIDSIEHLQIVGIPVVPHISYTSDSYDILTIAQGLQDRGWAMHVDEYPRPLIRGLWPWGMRPHADQYFSDLREVVDLVARGVISGRAGSSY